MKTVLSVKDLCLEINKNKNESKKILENISFDLKEGQTLGILGESGSGKSMTVKSILGLLDRNFKIKGEAIFDGKDLLKLTANELRQIRGKEITMVLQNPMTAFDSLYPIGKQLIESFRAHENANKDELKKKAIMLLESMNIKNPKEILKKYPHQLSGGMLQRIMIGLAIIVKPKLIIADEPTTAIDSINKMAIMNEFKKIKDNHNTAMIFISHDLGAISYISDEILVLNKGRESDRGTFNFILNNPKDEYTKLLISQRRAVMKKYRNAISGGKANA